MVNKPELLLPVGNIENFYAAVEGGANAVYLGLKQFNARGRARNFGFSHLLALLEIAHKRHVKVYVTLNTVIKNAEIQELLDFLHFLSQAKVDAVIIQDWGVYYLIQKYFSSLAVHASTQMGNHNSIGAKYSGKKAFERVILARELTEKEVGKIVAESPVEIEAFAHGALCYSFSGMCLFSSSLGGMSANRGLCAQPCRRTFHSQKSSKYIFSLKDFQLIDYVPFFVKNNISSIKVEGRLKSAEYVYTVARAYRMVIDSPLRIEEAKNLLRFDMGRDKTSYFFGGNVSESITESPTTGLRIGKVNGKDPDGIIIESYLPLSIGDRLRIIGEKTEQRRNFKIRELKKLTDMSYKVGTEEKAVVGEEVYLADRKLRKFPSKLPDIKNNTSRIPVKLKSKILTSFHTKGKNERQEIYVRINNIAWLRKVWLNAIDGLIIRLPRNDWADLDMNAPFLKKNKSKIYLEFPKFISESNIESYKNFAERAKEKGYNQFFISHLSQKEILPKATRFSSNENIYTFNDAAIKFLRSEKIDQFVYPLENDFENLLKSNDKGGIVPVYYYPELFYSRMPVKVDSADGSFIDDKKIGFKRIVRDGVTIVLPDIPVSLLQFREKLSKQGFRKFLIDLSYEDVSKNLFNKLINRLQKSEQVQPSSLFNFKANLK